MQIRILASLLIFSALFNAYQFGSLFFGCDECWFEIGFIDKIMRGMAILLALFFGVFVWLKKPWSRYFVYFYSTFISASLLFIYFSFLTTGSYESKYDLIRATTFSILTIAITVWACFVASKLKANKNG